MEGSAHSFFNGVGRVNNICTCPELHIMYELSSFLVSHSIKSLEHSHAVHGDHRSQ
jgi:hypothetical protein